MVFPLSVPQASWPVNQVSQLRENTAVDLRCSALIATANTSASVCIRATGKGVPRPASVQHDCVRQRGAAHPEPERRRNLDGAHVGGLLPHLARQRHHAEVRHPRGLVVSRRPRHGVIPPDGALGTEVEQLNPDEGDRRRYEKDPDELRPVAAGRCGEARDAG